MHCYTGFGHMFGGGQAAAVPSEVAADSCSKANRDIDAQ
jgi:hypothetical protein